MGVFSLRVLMRIFGVFWACIFIYSFIYSCIYFLFIFSIGLLAGLALIRRRQRCRRLRVFGKHDLCIPFAHGGKAATVLGAGA